MQHEETPGPDPLSLSLHRSELKEFFFAKNFTQLYYCIETQRGEGTCSGSHSKIVAVLGLQPRTPVWG